MDRALKCDHSLEAAAVERYFTVVLFLFQFYPACNFGKVINFYRLGTVKSETVNTSPTSLVFIFDLFLLET